MSVRASSEHEGRSLYEIVLHTSWLAHSSARVTRGREHSALLSCREPCPSSSRFTSTCAEKLSRLSVRAIRLESVGGLATASLPWGCSRPNGENNHLLYPLVGLFTRACFTLWWRLKTWRESRARHGGVRKPAREREESWRGQSAACWSTRPPRPPRCKTCWTVASCARILASSCAKAVRKPGPPGVCRLLPRRRAERPQARGQAQRWAGSRLGSGQVFLTGLGSDCHKRCQAQHPQRGGGHPHDNRCGRI
jgi:hypothetical protein